LQQGVGGRQSRSVPCPRGVQQWAKDGLQGGNRAELRQLPKGKKREGRNSGKKTGKNNFPAPALGRGEGRRNLTEGKSIAEKRTRRKRLPFPACSEEGRTFKYISCSQQGRSRRSIRTGYRPKKEQETVMLSKWHAIFQRFTKTKGHLNHKMRGRKKKIKPKKKKKKKKRDRITSVT